MSGSRSKFFASTSPLTSPTKRLGEVNWDDESDHEFDEDSQELAFDADDDAAAEFDVLNGAPKTLNFSPDKGSHKRTRNRGDDDDGSSDEESSEAPIEQTFRGSRQPLSPIKANSAYSQYLTASTSLNEHSKHQITAQVLEARVIDSVHDALVAQNQASFDNVRAFVSEFFNNEENFSATINAYEAKKSILGQNATPICVSFVVAKNNATNDEFILLGLSSPDVNRELQDRLNCAAETSEVAASFKFQVVMSEPASKDYQKLILAVTQHIGSPVANDPGRPCAEKAYFSSFIKLQQELGSDLAVKMICNVKFLPQLVTAQSPALPTDLVFDVGTRKFKMAIIAPCPDCKKNMAATALVMTAAKAGNQVVSPIKQNGIKRVLRNAPMFEPTIDRAQEAATSSTASGFTTPPPRRRFF